MKTLLSVMFLTVFLPLVISKVGKLLPPPGEESAEVGADGEPARGLKGQANPLASLQKTHAKCSIEGSYGIKNDCSKYTECKKKGQIPTQKYCPGGKFFDHKKRVCVKSSEAQCKNVCPSDGTMFPDPSDETGYLKCSKGVPMGHKCPSGQTYLGDKNSCSAGGGVPVAESEEAR